MRIVLVEDDKFFRQFYASKFKEQKVEVYEAADGEEGIAKIKEVKPDVILLDLIMPKKDGFGVLKDLSESTELKKIPVLVFSTLGQQSDVEKAKKLGARDYINKSFFDFEKLWKKVQNLNKDNYLQ